MRPGGRALMFAAGVSLAIGPAAWGATNPQMPSVVTGDLSRRDVRVPANEPSISGNWDSITHFRSQAPVDAGATPFQPWARAYFEAYGLGERNGTPRFDPNANCLPSGLPRVLAVPFGFEIVQTQMSNYMHIVPRAWSEHYRNNENAGGYDCSAVIVRKIGDAKVSWDVAVPDILKTAYPSGQIVKGG